MPRKDRKYHGQFGIPFSKIHSDGELAYVVPLKYKLLAVIVGPKYSGKTVVTSYLVEKLGYRFYSLSALVRNEVERLSLPLDREVLKREGDRLRRQFKRDILARRVVQDIRRDLVERQEPITHIVVDGIKNAGEVEFLRRLTPVAVIGVTASVDVRFNRARADGRFQGSKEAFVASVDQPDSNSVDDRGQQVDTCLSLVNHTITNEGSKQDLIREVEALLRKIGGIPT
jgi:dephospho-CoA kinase